MTRDIHLAELGLQDPEAELKEHAQHHKDFGTIQKLKLFLKSSLHTNSDGWVPNNAWNAVKDAHHAAYDKWIQNSKGIQNLVVKVCQ